MKSISQIAKEQDITKAKVRSIMLNVLKLDLNEFKNSRNIIIVPPKVESLIINRIEKEPVL